MATTLAELAPERQHAKCNSMNFKLCVLTCALWIAISAGSGEGAAEASDPLTQAYYEYIVAGYCGLVDRPVEIGFYLLRHDLLARGNVSPAEHQAAAQKAYLAADFEYQDRGLSGQKGWCRTEGAEYLDRFTQYFRYRRLP
jgi:hypothetical protein